MPWHGDTVEHGTVPRRHKCGVIVYRATNCYVVRCHAEASAKYTTVFLVVQMVKSVAGSLDLGTTDLY
jgi:hypothetical protein